MAKNDIRRFEVTLTGINPMLMHRDSVEWGDEMDAWLADPENKKNSKAGDDRTPAWKWMGGLYHDGEYVALPSANIMKCLMEAGALIPIGKGQSRATFKSKTQSGMVCEYPFFQFFNNGQRIKMADLNPLLEHGDFPHHLKTVRSLGFDLFTKRVPLPGARGSKHIRVRALFEKWSAKGTMVVWDPMITDGIFKDFWAYAGRYKGLGDWRPSAPKSPGSHGIFETKIKKLT